MKKIFYTFLLISPLLFVSSCEEDGNEDGPNTNCTGNAIADLIVGTWEGNTAYLYYPNGDLYECYNRCNSTVEFCIDEDCAVSTFNCDGTGETIVSNETTSFTWSYDPQSETVTSISPSGPFIWEIHTLNSNQFIVTDNVYTFDENGNQIELLVILSATRIN